MSRWKAAGLHTCISAAIGLILFAVLFGVWYPPPYFNAAGADELILVVAGVDLIVGPLLTLIVFKSGKKGLRFDLCVIALLQAAALVYGLSVVVKTRPVFLVAAVDRFILVRAVDISPGDLAEAKSPKYRSLSWTGPVLVASKIPSDPKEYSALLFSALKGKDIESFPKFYVDYSANAQSFIARGHSLSQLHPNDAHVSAILSEWLKQHNQISSGVVWLPLTAERHDLTMIIDRRNGQPLGAVDISPW